MEHTLAFGVPSVVYLSSVVLVLFSLTLTALKLKPAVSALMLFVYHFVFNLLNVNFLPVKGLQMKTTN